MRLSGQNAVKCLRIKEQAHRASPRSPVGRNPAEHFGQDVMKIAQVAPLYESVPPKYYGGTERVVSYLTEALVQMGHEVTLYASGDSVTEAELRAMRPRAVRLDQESIDGVADHILLAERVFQESAEFDLVHS